MNIRLSRRGSSVVIRLEGPLAVGPAVQELRRAVATALGSGARGLVLDLGGVGYLDAAGIGTLIACHRRALRGGQRVLLTGLRQRVHEVLQLTSLAGQLGEAIDTEQALRVLGVLESPFEARRDLPPGGPHQAVPRLA
jgi:anti-sigma B factor antagonist